MNNANTSGTLVGTIGSRQVVLKQDSEQSTDWADTFARMIIGGDAEKYLVERGLYKEAMAVSQ